MLEIILGALALGISTGTSCLTICAPFYIPYLISEERKLKVNFFEFSKFLWGRLAGYLFFGLLLGFLGQKLKVGWINVASTASLGILAFLIILHSFNFFKIKIKSHPICNILKTKEVKPPFWIGLLTGINPCPPFLLSLNYVFILGNITAGVVFFLFFFLATNVYLLPLIFLGKLGHFGEFRNLARWTLLIVGLVFFLYAVYNLITRQGILHYGLSN